MAPPPPPLSLLTLTLTLTLTLMILLLAPPVLPAKLPTYLKPCSVNDPKLNECAVKHGRDAIPSLLQGDRKYKIPRLQPMRIEEIRVDQEGSVGLQLVLKDVDIMGLQETELRDIDFDVKKKNLSIALFVPQLQLIGKYNISGRILILPIRGNGDCNITLENVPLNYSLRYDLVKVKGKDHIRPLDSSVGFDTTAAHFTFENLFDGDERLRSNVRQVVNDNWRQVVDDVGPTIVRAIGDVVTQLISNVVAIVPFNEVFLDVP